MIDSKIDRKTVLHAVKVVKEVHDRFHETAKKKSLIENNDLFIQITLKKVPKTKSIKMIKVKLPHSIVDETAEVCLITGDLDKRDHKAEIEPDVLHYKELLDKHGISQISQVITLRQLRTEYKPFEAKQKLLAAFDVFLADARIIECLPRVLGRHFFKKRKFPIRIDMKGTNLKKQIETALSTKVIYVTGHGNCCTSEVALLDMKKKDIVDNILSVVESMSKELPGSWENVMGVYLKTYKSKAIPIYMSYDNPNKVDLPDPKIENEFEIDDLSTQKYNVKVFSNGRVERVYSTKLKLESTTENLSDQEEAETESTTNRSMSVESDLGCEVEETEEVEMKKTKLKKKTAPKKEVAVIDSDMLDKPNIGRKTKKGKRTLPTETISDTVGSGEMQIQIKNIADSREQELNATGKKLKTQKQIRESNLKINLETESSAKGKKNNEVLQQYSEESNTNKKSVKMAKRKRAESESEVSHLEKADNCQSAIPMKKKLKLEDKNSFNRKQMLKNKRKRENRFKAK